MQQSQQSQNNLQISQNSENNQNMFLSHNLHTQLQQHNQISRSINYKNSFNIWQQINNFIINCFKCNDNQFSYIELLSQQQQITPIKIPQNFKDILNNKIIKLKIIQTSRLQLNPNIMHPFVRIHIIDKNTGCYLKVLNHRKKTVYQHQYNISYNKDQQKFICFQNDLILPFATNCCNFRQKGNSTGVWNQEFYINYQASELINSNTLILFQVLDFNHQALLYKNIDEQSEDYLNMFRVAWAYLRPVGIGKVHIGKSKLELYRYKYNPSISPEMCSKIYIPTVYYDFLWKNHEKYQGTLTVQLNHVIEPNHKFINEQQSYPLNLYEQQRSDKTYLKRYQQLIVNNGDNQKQISNKDLIKFCRTRQICQIPQQLVYKLQSQRLGCYRVKFMDNYILAACSSSKHTCIKVFTLEKGQHVMNLKGHRQIIHSMNIIKNYLITAGSDNFVRVWELKESLGEFIDQDQSQVYIKNQLLHTAAIYSTAVIFNALQKQMYILTCCYDGFIRLWHENLFNGQSTLKKDLLINTYQESPNKVYPTCCITVDAAYFIVGDSIGKIYILDFTESSFVIRNTINHEDLRNDLIQQIHVLNRNHIIIQASDNLIRHFELTSNRLKLVQSYSGAKFEKYVINCTISPDCKYLLAPSESGKPIMWDIFTGTKVQIEHLNLHIKGPLTSCDWHQKYNLIAISGFVELCPIFIFGNVLSQNQMKLVMPHRI